MVLQRWDPFRDLRQMEDSVARLWRGFGSPSSLRGEAGDWNIPLDVIQQGEAVVVKASVPGIDPADIDVSLEDNILTIRAERKPEAAAGDTYLVQERAAGSFFRALSLPDSVDTGKVESHYDKGVLTIILPKAEAKKKKQIQIKVSAPKEIEAKKAK